MAVPLVASRFVLRALAELRWPIAVYVVVLAVIGLRPAAGVLALRQQAMGQRLAASRHRPARSARSTPGWGPVTWSGVPRRTDRGRHPGRARRRSRSRTTPIRSVRRATSRATSSRCSSLAVVAAPIVEEIVFRGLILRGLLSRLGSGDGDRHAGAAVRGRPRRPRTWCAQRRPRPRAERGRRGARRRGLPVPPPRARACSRTPSSTASRWPSCCPAGRPIPSGLGMDRLGRRDDSCPEPRVGRFLSRIRAGGCRSGGRRRTRRRSPPRRRSLDDG